jgi:hypothetical protein
VVAERTAVSEYRKQLESVCNRLAAETESAEIRGEGIAMFVFAQNHGRAVEVYCGENDEVVVECWERERDSPNKEVAYASYDAATDATRIWLFG